VKDKTVLAILALSVSIVLAGWFVGSGFEAGRSRDRYVTVKGVSEQEVKADLALWPLQFSATSEDLSQAQKQIDGNVQKTLEFLEKYGIQTTQTELQNLKATDVWANPYNQNRPKDRFVVTQTLMVRSDEPESIRQASQKVGELVNAGVALTSGPEYGPGGPTFLFTRLNDLKPQMIADATARAREAAQQFALDSGSRISGIRQANQGIFVILPRDQAPGIQEPTELFKTVRVVATIDYLLAD